MKTLTRNEAIADLTDREYDILKELFATESKQIILPLISAGLGGFEKRTNKELSSDYSILYDEAVVIN